MQRVITVLKLLGLLVLLLGLLGLKQVTSHWAEKASETIKAPTKKTVAADVVPPLKPYEVKVFGKHLRTRFKRYAPTFKQAADQHDIPWRLLAAQAYQESHWNWKAKSPTGVRGIMMLTRNTAASLGIRNRLDPEQSIQGGAKYLVRMEARLPSQVKEPDRVYMALAAYNIGMGHLKDARRLALRLGKNPNQWDHLKTVLPLLRQKKYYRTLRYGYARGNEPVQYVERIRAYRKLMKVHRPQKPSGLFTEHATGATSGVKNAHAMETGNVTREGRKG